MSEDERTQEALTLLAAGDVEVSGRMPWASNATFLAELRHGDDAMLAIYKPGRGERPLWDFPPGLYRREVAAWVLSELLGWHLVPETVVRDGPLGEGSFQRFVDAHVEQHYFTLLEDERHHPGLRAICAFDLLANNTDRKGGHCLLGTEGTIYGIDHGVCFHEQTKLRTVIWDFAGEPVDDGLLADVAALLDRLPGGLDEWLTPHEIDALRSRAEWLLRVRRFPHPDPNAHCYPWPLV